MFKRSRGLGLIVVIIVVCIVAGIALGNALLARQNAVTHKQQPPQMPLRQMCSAAPANSPPCEIHRENTGDTCVFAARSSRFLLGGFFWSPQANTPARSLKEKHCGKF